MEYSKDRVRLSRRGGKREGAGRPAGTTKEKQQEERRRAALSGDLPHEFLLKIMRGETFNKEKPTLQMRIDAAKAAAPYYAPKLATVEVLQSMTDEDLDFIIKNAAAEVGVSFGAGREVPPHSEDPGTAPFTTGTGLH